MNSGGEDSPTRRKAQEGLCRDVKNDIRKAIFDIQLRERLLERMAAARSNLRVQGKAARAASSC